MIRNAQMEAMEHEANLGWLETHLLTHFPTLRASLPGGHVRSFVLTGLERADRHGFASINEQAHWLNLMALLGPDFDRDGSYPWVSAILQGPEPNFVRIQQLMAAVDEHVFGGTGKGSGNGR